MSASKQESRRCQYKLLEQIRVQMLYSEI